MGNKFFDIEFEIYRKDLQIEHRKIKIFENYNSFILLKNLWFNHTKKKGVAVENSDTHLWYDKKQFVF